MRSRVLRVLILVGAGMLLGSGEAMAASNACKADLNGDLVVNFGDLALLKSVFFQRCNDPGPTCGDGIAQTPEQCDDGNVLNGDGCSSTCQIAAVIKPGLLPATGQTTCWSPAAAVIPCPGTGQDGDLKKGAALAYVDNGDGTITDSNTGLMWEELDDDNVGGIHDVDNAYTWDDAFAVKIAQLSAGGGFAGHTDWRLPNLNELQSIRNLENAFPAVSPAFNTGCIAGCSVTTCSCTQSGFYLSSTASASSPGSVFTVYFGSGLELVSNKTESGLVRAVRGGP